MKQRYQKHLVRNAEPWIGVVAIILVMSILVPALALAGTADTEFQPLFQKFLDWVGGYLGKTLAVAALIGGLFIGIIRQSPIPAVAGVGAAIFAAYGPTVIQGLIGATF
jgi:conjugal transfer pilus assembly protein TraA